MKRIISFLLLLMLLLSACDNSQNNPSANVSSLPEGTSTSSGSKKPSTQTVALLIMGVLDHPTMQLIQLGFVEKAEQFEHYEPVISGLTNGSTEEVLYQWEKDVDAYNPDGFVMWAADDTASEFLSNQHAAGLKIVIPYFDVSALNAPNASELSGGTIDANPICDEGKRLSDAAEYIVNRLTQNGVTSGTIAFHGDSYYQPAFREYIEANSSFTVVERRVGDGIDNTPTIRDMVDHNDIVAVYNPLATPDEWAAVLGQSPKDAGIVYVAGTAGEDNLHALIAGEIDAIVSRPYYEAGYVGMEMLDRILKGETFEGDAWQPTLPTYIVTADGTGKNGPDFYLDQYARAEALFGPANQ